MHFVNHLSDYNIHTYFKHLFYKTTIHADHILFLLFNGAIDQVDFTSTRILSRWAVSGCATCPSCTGDFRYR